MQLTVWIRYNMLPTERALFARSMLSLENSLKFAIDIDLLFKIDLKVFSKSRIISLSSH